jgi:hypothetical protein
MIAYLALIIGVGSLVLQVMILCSIKGIRAMIGKDLAVFSDFMHTRIDAFLNVFKKHNEPKP